MFHQYPDNFKCRLKISFLTNNTLGQIACFHYPQSGQDHCNSERNDTQTPYGGHVVEPLQAGVGSLYLHKEGIELLLLLYRKKVFTIFNFCSGDSRAYTEIFFTSLLNCSFGSLSRSAPVFTPWCPASFIPTRSAIAVAVSG